MQTHREVKRGEKSRKEKETPGKEKKKSKHNPRLLLLPIMHNTRHTQQLPPPAPRRNTSSTQPQHTTSRFHPILTLNYTIRRRHRISRRLAQALDARKGHIALHRATPRGRFAGIKLRPFRMHEVVVRRNRRMRRTPVVLMVREPRRRQQVVRSRERSLRILRTRSPRRRTRRIRRSVVVVVVVLMPSDIRGRRVVQCPYRRVPRPPRRAEH